MSVKVKVDVDVQRIPPKIHKGVNRSQYILANQVHADMTPYVPWLSGDLANQSTIAVDGKSIYYNVPYARRRFYEPARRYSKPGTTARWDLKAKAIHGASWARVAGRAMNLK